jgi:LuxR family maltose regulon positive regulatory protein
VSSTPIRTKFYRPGLPSDLVDRTRLIDELNRGLDRPLTVISAPAGHGKSILVSAWLNTCDRPSAWLSLMKPWTTPASSCLLSGCDSDGLPDALLGTQNC